MELHFGHFVAIYWVVYMAIYTCSFKFYDIKIESLNYDMALDILFIPFSGFLWAINRYIAILLAVVCIPYNRSLTYTYINDRLG